MEVPRFFPEETVAGCLFGLALGDALGAPTEFLSVAEILRRWPPDGPPEPPGSTARVTDDTQMALAVGEAILYALRTGSLSAAATEPQLRQTFIEWLEAPETPSKAPGNTCLAACRRLRAGQPWLESTVIGSKGCGANMRVAPVGLLAGVDETIRSGLAQFQAALTHGHPTALAASDLTARAVWDLAGGGDPDNLPERLAAYARAARSTYHLEWLGELWRASGASSPAAFIESGWDECLRQLGRVAQALKAGDRQTAPCLLTGAGWVAEEAFGTALFCFLSFPDEPVQVLRRAAVTSGESDSIACIAGALAGARHGAAAWPAEWVGRVEYRRRIEGLIHGLSPSGRVSGTETVF